MKIHYLESYLMQPAHPITVALIGCGGTGSNVLSQLGKINASLKSLGHPGLFVTAFDADIVSEANVGRQLFSPSDIGLNKALTLISRINRFYGTDWFAMPALYNTHLDSHYHGHNIIMSCVDTAKARMEINDIISAHHSSSHPYTIYYWMDMGNTKDCGQVVLGTKGSINQPTSSKFQCVDNIPNLVEAYPDFAKDDKTSIQGPSCSVAQSLANQDLFINSMVAQFAGNIIWKLLKEGFIRNKGQFINLTTGRANPIKL